MKRALGVFGVALLFGCAQQVAPTGGPKDETPPKVVSETPPNLSTDFQAKQIAIEFDEYIQLNTPGEQIIISPPMMRQPTYQLKRKSLIIRFTQPLAANTTYTINFGEAIRDNNEGNILPNYTFVFSTGAYLDSMSVKGKLTDVLTGEPEPGALVMLYKNDVDSLPLDTLPDYFTRSDEAGNYQIHHVSDRPYKIFALKDENANYRFDVPTEKIGFIDTLILPYHPPVASVADSARSDTVAVDSSTVPSPSLMPKSGSDPLPSYDMVMFVEEDTTQFLKKAYCEHYGKLVFVYNLPVNRYDLSLMGFRSKKQWKLEERSRNADTITVWITDVVPDTMKWVLNVDALPPDTVELVMKDRDASSGSSVRLKGGKQKRKDSFALNAKFNPPAGRSPMPDAPLQIVWSHPIMALDIKRIKLYENGLRVLYDFQTQDRALRTYDIIYPWKKDKSYRLMVLDSAFNDFFGSWNDSLENTFTGMDLEQLGTLSLNILEDPATDLLIELVSASGTVLARKTARSKGPVQFTELMPGTYRVDAVLDANANGKWDSGRYLRKQQPERVVTVKTAAEIRPNWDLELEWNPNGLTP